LLIAAAKSAKSDGSRAGQVQARPPFAHFGAAMIWIATPIPYSRASAIVSSR
jgi:hypothetical protein